MTDTPNLTPAPGSLHWVSVYGAWIKAHEKILIIVLAALLLYRGGQGIENAFLHHDSKVASQAAIVVKSDDSSNKILLDQLAQMKADALAQQKALTTAIQQTNAALAAQQKKDAALSPTEIDTRWEGLVSLPPGSVVPLTVSTTSVTNEAAVQTVQALEEIPALKIQVTDLTTELNTDQKIIGQEDNTIIGLNKQIVDEKASHVADVNLEKAKAKKSFWRGFKIGFVVGAIGVEAIRVWAGRP